MMDGFGTALKANIVEEAIKEEKRSKSKLICLKERLLGRSELSK